MNRQAVIAWSVSGVATLVWLAVVLASGMGERVVGHWESAATMLFGSFLAGSSPEGGGAVAFPVFTKALGVPGPVARTFGLSIQAIGMTMVVVAILLNRRPIHARSAVLGSAAAVVGFLGAIVVLGQHDVVFWPMSIGAPWVKATFSIVLATTSFFMVRHIRHWTGTRPALRWTGRHDLGLVAVAFAGGVLSSLTGTGANILVFLFLVVLVDVDPKVALPTAIIVMATVSVVGFVLFGVVDGQLDVEVAAGRVVAVGGTATDLAASQADLLGLWLAAVPIVVWGAPLGSFVASKVRERQLVGFVAVLAAVEVATTVILVPELRTEAMLVAYLVVGLVLVPPAILVLERHKQRIFATEPMGAES